jgi:hypothetical protein
MWDSLADLISSLVAVLVVVIPFFIYVLISKRRLQTKRKKQERPSQNKDFKDTQVSTDVSEMEIAEGSEAPKTPDYYQPRPPQETRSASWNKVSTSTQEMDKAEAGGVFSRLEEFPLNKRAIVISEILGNPKAFKD